MTTIKPEDFFLEAAKEWSCGRYHADVRYIARSIDASLELWHASLTLAPLPVPIDNSMELQTSGFLIGQDIFDLESQDDFNSILMNAAQGKLKLSKTDVPLELSGDLQIYSELARRDSWFSPLHLRVNGGSTPVLSPLELSGLDSELRAGALPFDGFVDLSGWLGLTSPGTTGGLSELTVHVSPPIELGLNECKFVSGQLALRLYAHPGLDLTKVSVSVRGFPGAGLSSRRQVASLIEWKNSENEVVQGDVSVDLSECDQVIVMLRGFTNEVQRFLK